MGADWRYHASVSFRKLRKTTEKFEPDEPVSGRITTEHHFEGRDVNLVKPAGSLFDSVTTHFFSCFSVCRLFYVRSTKWYNCNTKVPVCWRN